MDKETIRILEGVIAEDLETIRTMGCGTKERQAAINDVCNLMSKRAEFERIENDNTHKEIDEQLRTEMREEQQEIDARRVTMDRIMKMAEWGFRISMFVVEQTAFRGNLGMLMCYENSNSFTRQASRNYIRDLKSPRK